MHAYVTAITPLSMALAEVLTVAITAVHRLLTTKRG